MNESYLLGSYCTQMIYFTCFFRFRDPRGRNRPTPDMAVGVARSLGIVNFTLQTLLDEDSAAVPVTIRSQVPKKTVSALTPAAPTSGSPTGPTAAAVHMHMHPTDTSMARVPDQIVSGMKRKVRPSQDSTFIKYSTNQKKIPMNTHPRSSAFSLLHPNVNMNIPTQLYSSPKKKSKRHYFPSESTFSRRSSRRAHVISPDHDQFKMLPYPSLDFDLMSSLEKEHIEFHHKLQTRAYIAQTAASNASNFGPTNENNNEIKNITHRETGVTFHNSIDIDNKDNDHGKIQKREVHMKHIYVNQFNHTERQAVTAMMSLQSGL